MRGISQVSHEGRLGSASGGSFGPGVRGGGAAVGSTAIDGTVRAFPVPRMQGRIFVVDR
jgi:hypothetical protein